MIKQTAVFEAAAAFVLLCVYGSVGQRARILALFVAGAAAVPSAFSLYFAAHGHFRDLFDAVVVFAMHRLNDEVVAGYGAENAFYLTLHGAAVNAFLRSLPVVFLWGGVIFALLRLKLVRSVVPARILVVAAVWLAFAFAEVVYGRLLCDYYLLAIVPPLLIIAGALFCHGLRFPPPRRAAAFWGSIGLAILALLYTERSILFEADPLGVDRLLTSRAVDAFSRLGLHPEDRLLVLNRGMELYTATGALPPSPYFHTTHLVSAFETPIADPLGAALGDNPRFVAVADTAVRHITELPQRLARAETYLAAHYRVAAVVHGAWDSFTIYEFVG